MDNEEDPPEPPTKRHKCSACYKQYKKKEYLVEHMKTAYHSIHQPKCVVCEKHCKSFESLREHLTGPLAKGLCSAVFSQYGCQLCLTRFDSHASLSDHRETCRLAAPVPLGTNEFPCTNIHNNFLDSSDENDADCLPRAIAMDCEMVGGGSDGSLELCARVCLVDEDENLIFHTYVKPQIPVTNYRYDITGLTEEHLQDGMPLKEVREKILQILYNGESIGKVRLDGGKARLLVGHDLAHDLDCLGMSYPDHLMRDTAKYRPLMKTNLVCYSLKYLTRTYLGYDIQTGTHNPYEDCISVMRLYKRIRGQSHKEKGYRTLTPSDNILDMFDSWRSKELDNLTPDELYAISKSDYRCWCLDLKPRLAQA
ncbi:putative exoribonuclease II transcription factor C2H2 family [Medicago truncatula]|uniref:RNA exonuclease 4 n=4 Tax=Medicago TaxID=3877 RepID=B7FI33_MEDTR|nr:apoptosis-enhancing nuclease [Medicago truncatula]ACJ84412.1 unknown [Medicago truncatula]AES67875.1 RNA exonuclease-like protein [Medicago truncatula]AFK40241.1 unknown [Medicago truncatula]RHN76293.1 putative exoribonuclease II transcription factor C2H2 family [Medicago truncatula]